MKSHFVPAALGSLLLFGTALHAQVPQLINYQGRVVVGTTNFNSPPNGLFKFALVNAAGTTTYWRNSPDTTPADGVPDLSVALTVTKGLYAVLLGDTSITNMAAIPASVWANPDVRLRVWFNDGPNGNQLLTPDQRLAPYGYLPDGSVSTAAIASGAITSTKIATGAVTNTQLAPNAVQAASIAAGAVGSTQIANTSVTAAKFASDVGLWSVTGADVFRSGGRVGIGTNPTSKLHISALAADGSPLRLQIDGASRFTVASNGGASIGALNDFPPANGLFVQGHVGIGIGTTDPAYNLHVKDSGAETGRIQVGGTGPNGSMKIVSFGDGDLVYMGENGADDTMELRATNFYFKQGNVGIGTPTPDKPLVVAATQEAEIGILSTSSAGRLWTIQSSGTYGNPALDGTFQIIDRTAGLVGLKILPTGTVSVKVLKIDGADVAEPFDIATEDAPKGAVVVIDEENPGRLKVSNRAYDRRVAGILSGANGVRAGICLSQEGFNEGGQNVALSGRVYVQADASNGAIQPGDMLTTSDLPGYSMKATDYTRAQGAIIGKAMSSLIKGTGMVLVLVTLQ